MRILLRDTPHPLAHAHFEALLYTVSAGLVTQVTGLTRIGTLLYRLRPISFFGPTHEAWCPCFSAAHPRTMRRMPNILPFHAWKSRYPIGDPSSGPPKALVNLRQHQARVMTL